MSRNLIGVYKRMAPSDTYDFVLLSVIFSLLEELHIRCGTRYREDRVEAMQAKLSQLIESYEGYLEDSYIKRAEKFLKYLHTDMDSLIKDIKVLKEAI